MITLHDHDLVWRWKAIMRSGFKNERGKISPNQDLNQSPIEPKASVLSMRFTDPLIWLVLSSVIQTTLKISKSCKKEFFFSLFVLCLGFPNACFAKIKSWFDVLKLFFSQQWLCNMDHYLHPDLRKLKFPPDNWDYSTIIIIDLFIYVLHLALISIIVQLSPCERSE